MSARSKPLFLEFLCGILLAGALLSWQVDDADAAEVAPAASAAASTAAATATGVPDEHIRSFLAERIELESRRAEVAEQKARIDQSRQAAAAQAQADAERRREAQQAAARAEYEACTTELQSCKSQCSMNSSLAGFGATGLAAAQVGLAGMACLTDCSSRYSCQAP